MRRGCPCGCCRGFACSLSCDGLQGCTLPGGANPPGQPDWSDDSTWVPTPGNVALEGVVGARFDHCTFTRLGACGLALTGGTQNTTVQFSTFTDISASAVSIGGTDTFNETDPARQDADNSLTDSVVRDVAREFHGAPGISIFYGRGSSILHNEIVGLPYSGVSIGWGWGRTMERLWPRMPWDGENAVSYNHIHDVMTMLGDGGAIYTLGPQGNLPFPRGPSGKAYPDTPPPGFALLAPSTMIGNYIHDTGPVDGAPQEPGYGSHIPGGLYNDEGSTNWAMVGNVVVDTPVGPPPRRRSRPRPIPQPPDTLQPNTPPCARSLPPPG